MKFIQNRKSITIAPGLFKRTKKGDKNKFIKALNSIGYTGDVNKAWKDYLSL